MIQERIWESYGIARSLAIYYRPLRVRKLRQFYTKFIQPGDLCFDIGAHVGNRIRAWTQLGARVVAVEPHPTLMRVLHRWFGAHPNVVLLEEAVAAESGQAIMHISHRTPTLTTLSPDWAAQVRLDKAFRGVRWDTEMPVRVTTLDVLIARYGVPAFCKIDVEGYELEALRGVSHPLRHLSFEMIPATRGIAMACVERLCTLAAYEFTFSPGESLQFAWEGWITQADVLSWLKGLADDAPSGDIYARIR